MTRSQPFTTGLPSRPTPWLERFRERIFLGLFLTALTLAEIAVTFVSPLLVFPLHGGLLACISAWLVWQREHEASYRMARAIALALAVAPLIRIISLTLPLAQLDPTIRFAAAGIPMAVGGILAARWAGYQFADIGIAWHRTTWQIRVVLASVGFGFIEFAILRPDALGPLPWTAAGFLPALSTGVFTGLPEELIFRGVMQTATRPFLGRWNWVYVSAVFAVLHVGYQSVIDLLFVFAVGLIYGWVFEQTRSIVGIAIGHGLANIVLFFVAPNLISPAALPGIGPGAEILAAGVATAALAVGGYRYWKPGPLLATAASQPAAVARDNPVPRPYTQLPTVTETTVAPGTGLRLTIIADPLATGIDPIGQVIPARREAIPVMAQVALSPTDVEVEARRAVGFVRFGNRDDRQVIIPPGIVLRATNGATYRTTDGAVLAPLTDGAERSVDIPVEAEVPGTAANLGAGQLTSTPARLKGMRLSVDNPEPITGGSRREIRRVGIVDYDAALEAASTALWRDLAARLDVKRLGAGATRYAQADTAELDDIVIDPQASQVVNTRADSIILTARATASVTTVDVASMREAFTAYFVASIPYGLELVPGSLQARVVAATRDQRRVSCVVEATSWRLRPMPAAPEVT